MSELIPAEEHDTFASHEDRRVVATVLWRRDAIVGIVVVRRRDGRSALIRVPELAQAMLAHILELDISQPTRPPASGVPTAGKRSPD